MIIREDQERVRREVNPQAQLGRSWRGFPIVSVWNRKAKMPDKYIGRTLDEAIANAKNGKLATAAELVR
jgi:hypothetical protein